ncbi:hypothetical protein [Kutzneria buriramensis]|uniref:Uncharacterized protein n=1 Tax=Kutzneria buriramensis TaxID=1045776 RepID=A0A3E0GWQ2_9PSEU|nr:hypothetical protein [Kutzneria buriramensis]REH30996.1 hypothetical protein BCF44_12219 [Kutzneria buriramensis]
MRTTGRQRTTSAAPPTEQSSRVRSLLTRLRPHGTLGWIRRSLGITVIGLIALGLYQGFLATTPATQHTVTVAQPPVVGAVDVWLSHGNGAVRLTTAAVVVVDSLTVDGHHGPVQRVLYDIPATAKVGDHMSAWISEDGLQVRVGPLPGPPVLPGPQGAALLFGAVAWLVLGLVIRRRARRTAVA